MLLQLTQKFREIPISHQALIKLEKHIWSIGVLFVTKNPRTRFFQKMWLYHVLR